MTTHFPSPHEGIATHSQVGSPLRVRLHLSDGRWVRVHEDGGMELAQGSSRVEDWVKPISPADPQGLRAGQAVRVSDELRARLAPQDLEKRPDWDRYYPVQAFAGPESSVIEGRIYVESEMGYRTDIGGIRGTRQENDALLAIIDALLKAGK